MFVCSEAGWVSLIMHCVRSAFGSIQKWLLQQSHHRKPLRHRRETAISHHVQVGWLGGDGSEVMDDPISIDVCDASNI